MSARVSFADRAVTDLRDIYDHIAPLAGARTARNHVARLYAYCLDLRTFPERGTRRDDLRPGLRLIGYRRQATIAFAVIGKDLIVLRVFARGRDVESLLTEEDEPQR